MKRIKNIVAGVAALVLGTSFAFADKAQYDKLLAEAKQYEEKGKWCSALGTYWDAIGSNPGDAKEAQEEFERIYNVYGEYGYDFLGIPNPGPGEYDDFSRYDGWIELCKDFEIYWNEHPGEIFTTNLKCSKGDVDMKTRTASYNFTLVADYSKKFSRIGTRICFIFRRAYKKYGSDWPDIPEQWPAVSMFKDPKTIPVVKFISATCKPGATTGHKKIFFDLKPYMIPPSYAGGAEGILFYDGKTTDAYVAAWNNFLAIEPYSDSAWVSRNDVGAQYKNMSIKVSIKDENGRTIASMKEAAPFGEFGSLSGYEHGRFSSVFTLSGISASDIKLLDSGKWTYSIDSFVLIPREVTANAENLGGGSLPDTKFTNVKYKAVSPTIDYLKGNAGFASVDVFEQNKKAMAEQETEKNKASYVQNYFDSRKLTFEHSSYEPKGFLWDIKLTTKTLACKDQKGENYNDYKYVIVERKNLDGNGQVNKNTPILGTVDDLLVQLNAMDSKDAKWEVDVKDRNHVFRYLTESEVIQKKQEYLTQYKKADTEEKKTIVREVSWWKERSHAEEIEIVSELYKYLSAMQSFDEGKMHANISDLTLEEKKGVVTVKAVAGEFESKGLKKKDVITQMSLKEYDGSTRAVTVSELPKIPGQSTLIFTIQRGSGKKSQELTIEVPVEWNGRWSGSDWY